MDVENGPKTLVFIRHGQSLRNKYGVTPFLPGEPGVYQDILRRITDHGMPLTEEGLRQATKTGEGLRERFGAPFAIFYSDYLRAMQTTLAIVEALSEKQRKKLLSSAEEMCRERCLGPVHNMTHKEARKMFSDIDRLSRKMSEFKHRPPQGESLLDVTNRAKCFLEGIFSKNFKGKTIYIVAHYRFIQCAIWALSGPSGHSFDEVFRSSEMHLRNCGIVVYNFDKKNKRMNLVEHGTVFYEIDSNTPY